MTKFRSSFAALLLSLLAAGCAASSGAPATGIAQPDIASAYLPLHARVHLGIDSADGAAVVIAPHIAVTNAHNANLLDAKRVIGVATQSDLLFFHANGGPSPATAAPVVGEAVTAYGQDTERRLRLAQGVVRQIVMVPGYSTSPYFIFAGNAGPGFSGGPVIDPDGKLIGITFGYKDQGSERLIYAYDLARVLTELSLVEKEPHHG